ncbi:amino acid ABC transporter permease [Phyllobacterium sp. SB3]|uniref:amino acid ABC transporter permease n=1 Tax=Phyllobacterium sp. SB3 TaxID=3156073 RepID=UPI0032AF74CF
MGYSLHFDAVWSNFDSLMSGLVIGLVMALISLIAGTVIGLLGAFISRGSVAGRWLVGIYVMLIRNLPLLVIVLLLYFALPQLGIRLDKYKSFICALSLYSGAYLIEVFRGGLSSVPVGQVEAARAIGLTRIQTNLYVVMPIMFRNVLPSLSNTFIGIFKDSSIAAAIAIPELTFEARRINTNTFRVVETWLIVSSLYVVTCSVMSFILQRIERRFPKF